MSLSRMRPKVSASGERTILHTFEYNPSFFCKDMLGRETMDHGAVGTGIPATGSDEVPVAAALCCTAATPNVHYADILERHGQPSVCIAGCGQKVPEGDNDLGWRIRLADQHIPVSERTGVTQRVRAASGVDHRDGGMPASCVPAHRDAVPLARHMNVRHHGVEPVWAVNQYNCFVASTGLDDLEPLVVENLCQDNADQVLILDD